MRSLSGIAIAKAIEDEARVDLLSLVTKLADYLEESHLDELASNHYGDGPDDCSYCQVIKEARIAITRAEGR